MHYDFKLPSEHIDIRGNRYVNSKTTVELINCTVWYVFCKVILYKLLLLYFLFYNKLSFVFLYYLLPCDG